MKVSCDPRDETFVKKTFEIKGVVRLNDIIKKVRLKGTRPYGFVRMLRMVFKLIGRVTCS